MLVALALLLAVATSAAYAPPALPMRQQLRSCGCQLNEERRTPPVGLRTLSRQDILDKLNGVPTFSITNDAGQMLSAPDENAVPTCTFYLEIADAQAALAELRATNPRAAMDIAVVPLGTAFALGEWQEQPDNLRGEPLSEVWPDSDYADGSEWNDNVADDSDDFVDDATVLGGSEASEYDVRLQAARTEMESVRGVLRKAPVPPLLRRRNAREGPIPLFGSDELRFQLPSEADPAAGRTDASEEESESGREEEAPALLPLFFRREDLLAAWCASGGTLEQLPAVQVTDLRTIAWQMQFDTSQDWKPMLFVAPEPAIEFVKQQQEADAQGLREQRRQATLSNSDVQGLVFGGRDFA